jgi:hypothetical protein
MELLDRYLNAVRTNLPKDQADDIVAEIADDLQSQADEREAMLHRPLTRDESADVIRAYGHPRVVAARYAKVQYLIGPELLPFYWYVLRMVLVIVVALELAGAVIGAFAAGNPEVFSHTLGFLWDSLFLVVGIVTVIFAIIERVPTKVSPLDRLGITKWDPRALAAAGEPRVPRLTSIFEALANALFALVLLDINGLSRPINAIMLGPVTPNFPFHATGAWHPLYVTLIVSSLTLALSGIATFVNPRWVKVRLYVLVAANALVIVGAVLTLRGGTLFAPMNATLNAIGTWGLYCGIAIAAITASFGSLRLRPVRHT